VVLGREEGRQEPCRKTSPRPGLDGAERFLCGVVNERVPSGGYRADRGRPQVGGIDARPDDDARRYNGKNRKDSAAAQPLRGVPLTQPTRRGRPRWRGVRRRPASRARWAPIRTPGAPSKRRGRLAVRWGVAADRPYGRVGTHATLIHRTHEPCASVQGAGGAK
jgi:hypothetical protein